MKVLIVSNVYPIGEGTGTPSIKIQKQILEGFGVEIDVYPIETGNKLAYLRAAVYFLTTNFHQKGYDIIHAYYGLSAFIAVLQRKVPVIATFLGSDILSDGLHNDRDRRFSKVAIRKASEMVVMSEEMKESSGRSDAHVIPFGVHLPEFKVQEKSAAREKLGLSQEKKYVLFPWDTARQVKRFDLVDAAMKLTKDQIKDVELIAIFNKGHQEVVDYMNACDVVVMTSDHEGSPVSIREALACNMPVVSVDVGDVAELLDGVANCFLVEKDARSIAGGLEKVLRNGKRSNGREKMSAYDMENATEQVFKLYQKIISNV